MRLYNQQHAFYCGIDLHKKTMYLCIIDERGEIVLHKNMRTHRAEFMHAIASFREDLVVGCECMFVADDASAVVLGRRSVRESRDRVRSRPRALHARDLRREGNFPVAYVYPAEWRPTRDLLRRRGYFKRSRAELLTHVQNTVIL